MSKYEKMSFQEIGRFLDQIEARLAQIRPTKMKYVFFGKPEFSQDHQAEIQFLTDFRKSLFETLDGVGISPEQGIEEIEPMDDAGPTGGLRAVSGR
jgi:hypothetical protein